MKKLLTGVIIGMAAVGIATAPAASAGIMMNAHTLPSINSPVIGNIDADCSTVDHAIKKVHQPGVPGVWYLTSAGWVLDGGAAPAWCI